MLWLSAVWHFPENSDFAPVDIALTSNGGGFGWALHALHKDQPVLPIITAWGGKGMRDGMVKMPGKK